MSQNPTGGRAFADALVEEQVESIFMIPGVQLDWAVEGLRQRSQDLKLYVPRHEQATTHMADGYYRASGRPGFAMVVPGPGVLNAAAGLSTAYASNSQVVFAAAQIHAECMGQGFGNLHEINGQSELIANLTKWHTCVSTPTAIPQAVHDAFTEVRQGRPRPVGLEIPFNFLQATPDFAPVQRKAPASPAAPDAKLIDQIAQRIDQAELPILYVGGGALAGNAPAALQRLAERAGIPVVMSDNGLGAMSYRHPLAMNTLAGRALFEHADLVVVVGSRFMDVMTPTTSWNKPGPEFIHINIDANDLKAPRRAVIALQAEASVALDALADQVRARQVLSPQESQALKHWAQQQVDQVQPQTAIIQAMRDALPEDGIFVNELTQVGYLCRVALPIYGPRTYIGPGYQGTLGYSLPTALGAAVGGGGRRVLAITGDGGLGWSMSELATARKYNLPVTLVIFNDGHYGNVRAIQKRVFGEDKTVAVELTNPEFMPLAAAFGIPAKRVTDAAALGGAIRDSLREPGPVIIEMPLGEMPSPWHLLRLEPMPGVKGGQTAPNPLDGRFAGQGH